MLEPNRSEDSDERNKNPNSKPDWTKVLKSKHYTAYGLPNQTWPSSGLKYPTNLCRGFTPIIIKHDSSQSLKDALIECYQELPEKGVLVVVFSEEVMKIVNEIQNIRKVILLEKDEQVSDGKGVPLETTEIRKWLDEKSEYQDLITSASVIAGFEWPSVLMITSNKSSSQFYVRNIVMRAMSRLVWLKTELLDDLIDGENTGSFHKYDDDGLQQAVFIKKG